MWLLRFVFSLRFNDVRNLTRFGSGLHFVLVGLQSSYTNKDEELATSFTNAYGVTLRQYHNFVVKGVFSVSYYFALEWIISRTIFL